MKKYSAEFMVLFIGFVLIINGISGFFSYVPSLEMIVSYSIAAFFFLYSEIVLIEIDREKVKKVLVFFHYLFLFLSILSLITGPLILMHNQNLLFKLHSNLNSITITGFGLTIMSFGIKLIFEREKVKL